jgi:hypothetical protein
VIQPGAILYFIYLSIYIYGTNLDSVLNVSSRLMLNSMNII